MMITVQRLDNRRIPKPDGQRFNPERLPALIHRPASSPQRKPMISARLANATIGKLHAITNKEQQPLSRKLNSQAAKNCQSGRLVAQISSKEQRRETRSAERQFAQAPAQKV